MKSLEQRSEFLVDTFDQLLRNARQMRPPNYAFASWVLEAMMENNVKPNERLMRYNNQFVQHRRTQLMRSKNDENADEEMRTLKEFSDLFVTFKNHFHL
jgi:hypothetical protein